MSNPKKFVIIAMKAATAMAVTLGSAYADVLFFDDFENPDVEPTYKVQETSQKVDGNKWVRSDEGFGHQMVGIVDEGENGGSNFTDPNGSQALATRYTNSGVSTVEGVIGPLTKGVTYKVSFDVVTDGYKDGAAYNVGLVTYAAGARRSDMTPDPEVKTALSTGASGLLAFKEGEASGSQYQTVTFSYTADGSEKSLGHDLAVRIIGATHSANIDNVKVEASGAAQPGGGRIQPVPASQRGNTYADWIERYTIHGDKMGFNVDADGDGIVNGLENFFGTAPDRPSSGLTGGRGQGTGSNEFTFQHPENPNPAENISPPAYYWSKDQRTFHPSGEMVDGTVITFERSANTPSSGVTTVTAKVRGVVPPEIYVNVAVTLNP